MTKKKPLTELQKFILELEVAVRNAKPISKIKWTTLAWITKYPEWKLVTHFYPKKEKWEDFVMKLDKLIEEYGIENIRIVPYMDLSSIDIYVYQPVKRR